MKKRLILLASLMVLTFLGGRVFAAQDEIKVVYESKEVDFKDAKPFINDKGQTMVPIGVLAEIFNYKTGWDDQTKTAYIYNVPDSFQYKKTVALTVGNSFMWIVREDGFETAVQMEAEVMLKDNRVYILLKAVSQELKFEVSWNEKAKIVNIYKSSFMEYMESMQETGTNENNSIVSVNSAFDFNLLDKMPKDENYVISPTSLKMALAMSANGAEGQTKDEILKTLDIGDLDVYNNQVSYTIGMADALKDIDLSIANSIWINKDAFDGDTVDFSDSFKDSIESFYNGKSGIIDEATGVKDINKWISESTKGEINEVLSSDDIDENTLSLLVNTVYFNGDWKDPFDDAYTRWGLFYDRNGKECNAKFMQNTEHMPYDDNENFEIVSKPYIDERLKMYIVLPKEGGKITEANFNEALKQMKDRSVTLKLPTFETEIKHENLVQILEELGIEAAFNSAKADFLNQYSGKLDDNPWISDVIQKASIYVNEQGTVASAGTVVINVYRSAHDDIINFTCDRPFYYFIRNDKTGDILFMGEYAFVEGES